MLTLKNLSISVENKQIIHGLSLDFQPGKVAAIMGPNGSGKSTLAFSVIGHPAYKILNGSIIMAGKDIASMSVDERARAGIFVAFQYPQVIPGVKVIDFLKESYRALTEDEINIDEFQTQARDAFKLVGLDDSFLFRGLNEGFSGGEKKRLEIAQLILFKPKIAILDEIDSGLDIDAIKKIASALLLARKENPQMSIILITHYQRILDYITPDVVHVLINGNVVSTGASDLAQAVENQGYNEF